MNEWLLLIPIGVLMLVTGPTFAWMHRVNERYRRAGGDREPKNR